MVVIWTWDRSIVTQAGQLSVLGCGLLLEVTGAAGVASGWLIVAGADGSGPHWFVPAVGFRPHLRCGRP